MTFDVKYVGRTDLKLNGQLLPAEELRITSKDAEGKTRRNWKFRIRLRGVESHERLNDLVGDGELALEYEGETIRTEVSRPAWSHSGDNDQDTIYSYQFDLKELFDGEPAKPSGASGFAYSMMSEMIPIIIDVAMAVSEIGLQRHELRLRGIENQLGIDNSQAIAKWNEAMDRRAEEGWISRFPWMAQDIPEEFRTEKVRQVLEKFEREDSKNEDGKERQAQ